MAIKPTIYKLTISLSDLDRNYYDSLNLTIALHPSENLERMMARVIAYCINAQEYLSFTKGLSETEVPDIWVRTLDDQIALWIDLGEPSIDRVKKSCRQAQEVKVYCFNTKSDVWWEQSKNKINLLKASVYQFQWEEIQALAALVERTMSISVTITDGSAFVATKLGECDISWETLQES